MPEGALLGLILSGVLLVFSAFFSSSEAAFLSLPKTRIAHLVSIGMPGAGRVANMVRDPERLLSTILLGNNLANVGFAALVTVIIASRLGEGNEGKAAVIATGVVTAIVLIAGETIPKTVAIRHAERVAFWYSRPLIWTETLLWPLVFVLRWITGHVTSLLVSGSVTGSITEGEFLTLIDIGETEGTFEPAEAEMLENVFRFGDRQVREVMTPRTEIVSIERGAVLKELLAIYAEHSHTRLPVYRDSTDNIIGIVSAKDVLRGMSTKGIDLDHPVADVIRDAYFVPETKRIAELFDEMRQSGNQMAMAVDEYGGLAGLVTLKRFTEEVLGPVGEEGEGTEEEYEAIDRYTFQVDGGMSIQEANEELEIDLPEGEFETVAGFVLDVLGHIPGQGERFERGGLKFEVTEMNNLKIETIKVTSPRPIGSGAPPETEPGQAPRGPTE